MMRSPWSRILVCGLTAILTVGLSVVLVNSAEAARSVNSLTTNTAVTVYQETESGNPTYVSGDLSGPIRAGDEINAVFSFFEAHKQSYRMSDPSTELSAVRVDLDQLGMRHVRLRQIYQGLTVIGGDLIAHFNTDDRLKTVNGTFIPKISLDPVPRLSETEAEQTARADLDTSFLDSDLQSQELVVFPWEGHNYLAWRMFFFSNTPMGRWEVFVDAGTGEVIYKANRIMDADAIGTGISVMGDPRNHIDTDSTGSGFEMIDRTRTTDNNPHGHNGQMPPGNDIRTYIASSSLPGTLAADADNIWDVPNVQPPAVDGHVYSALVYDWLLATFGRNSYDDAGASMITSVNYTGVGINNAFWNGTQIIILDWSAGWRSLAACPDVVSHEWGHAVTEYTSGLVYEKEPGALNESFSDMMGAAFEFAHGSFDPPDWELGENSQTTGEAFRSMSNPHVYDQPDTYGPSDPNWFDLEECDPGFWNDYCGVHTNSGVGNKWFYLLSNGGIHNGQSITGIGVANAMSIAFRANTFYWTPLTDYSNAALGTIDAANDLDLSGVWAQSALDAWNAVQVQLPGPALAFDFPDGIPSLLVPDAPTSFRVVVSGVGDGIPVPFSGRLHYAFNGGSYTDVSMTVLAGDSYEATLPAIACKDFIEFYVSAEETTAGVFLDTSPESANLAASGSIQLLLFEDNFETDKGWTFESDWGRGVPTGNGGAWGGPDPGAARSLPNVFGYNLDGDYQGGLSERALTSPSIDCTNLSNVHLNFWRWLGVEQSPYDHAYIRVSNDGSNYVTVWENDVEIADTDWMNMDVDISRVAANQSNVTIRFVMGTTDGRWVYCGWNIDDLQVTAYDCVGIGDTDGDGVPNSSDNCHLVYNDGQEDGDTDGVGDVCDNCPVDWNPGQIDIDRDGFGTLCDCNDSDPDINPNTVWYFDFDEDTFGDQSNTLTQCVQPTGYVLDGTDCNDSNPDIHPRVWYPDQDGDSFGGTIGDTMACFQPPGFLSNSDDCDDWDAAINPNTIWYRDYDEDGFGYNTITLTQCQQPPGYILQPGDCNDNNPVINPNTIWYQDSDDDNYGNPLVSLTLCDPPHGWVLDGTDCDDSDSSVYPDAVWYLDQDGDTFGDPLSDTTACSQPPGYASNSDDCDDSDGAINPNTIWYIDLDGDGFGYDAFTRTQCQQPSDYDYVLVPGDCNDSNPEINPNTIWYQDSDGDRFGDQSIRLIQCVQPGGYVLDSTDCDDSNPDLHPHVWYVDQDGDTFGDPLSDTSACNQPPGYVSNTDDCNDSDSSINPNTIWYRDIDGDGFGDDGVMLTQCQQPLDYVILPGDCDITDPQIHPNTIWYLDSDGDTFGDPSIRLIQCIQPDGYVLDSTDCDDSDPGMNPVAFTWYLDQDGDTFGDPQGDTTACYQPPGYVSNLDDCNDSDSAINPNTIWYRDFDGDGFGVDTVSVVQCEQPPGFAIEAGDCDEASSWINPNSTWRKDADGDGFCAYDSVQIQCEQPEGYIRCSLRDCDDADSTIGHNTSDWYEDPDQDGIGSAYGGGGCLPPPPGYVITTGDNCPDVFNPGQEDNNEDGIGDACCCEGKTGDANLQGGEIPSVADIGAIVDMLFITGTEVPCIAEADVNQSGGSSPTPDDITVADISTIVDHLFISGQELPDCPIMAK